MLFDSLSKNSVLKYFFLKILQSALKVTQFRFTGRPSGSQGKSVAKVKENSEMGHSGRLLVIPALEEAEAGGLHDQAQSGYLNDLVRPCLKMRGRRGRSGLRKVSSLRV